MPPFDRGIPATGTQARQSLSSRSTAVELTSDPMILCVDDDPISLKIRAKMLSLDGYDVLTASDADTAMELFLKHPISLVITDHLLPGRSGAVLAAAMKSSNPNVPIIILSGLPEFPAEALVADLFLTKGMAPERFLAEVSNLVHKRVKSTSS
jgi:DNA-binding response OmpR family regulator